MSSTKPLSLSVSVWIATCVSVISATVRQLSIAAGVVPQSSCSFRPMAPARDLLAQRFGQRGVALAQEAQVHREGLGRLQHAVDVLGPRRAGRGVGAGGRAGAAAEHGGDARHQRLLDLLRADEVDVAVDAAGGDDQAFAGDDLGARADDDVDAGLGVGVAGLADGRDAAALEADVGLDDAPVVDDQRVGDDAVAGLVLAGPLTRWLWPMPSRMVLPPPNLTSSP